MQKAKSKKYIIATTIVVAAIAALLTWWLWPKGYEDFIPAQSKAVIRINPAKIKDQAGGQTLPACLGEMIAGTTSGIDMSKPVYAFITPNEYFCITAKIDDEDEFARALAQKAKLNTGNIDKSDGRNWAWINSGWLVSWDNSNMLCIGPGVAKERDLLRQTITAMINSGDNFTSTDAFNKLKAIDGSIQIYTQLDAVPAPYNMLFRLGVPPDCDPAAIHVFAAANVKHSKQGQLTMSDINCEITSDNDDIINAINAFEQSKGCITTPPTATTAGHLLFMATRAKGKPLLQLLKTDATLRGLLMGLNQTFDADQMIGSTDGLFSIAIDAFGKDWTPSFCIKAETHTSHLFDDANYWLQSAHKQKNVLLKQLSDHAFYLSSDKQQLNFGLQDCNNALYFTSPQMIGEAKKPFGFDKSNSANGTLVYISLDVNGLLKQPCFEQGGLHDLIRKFTLGAQHITYQAMSGRKATISIE